MNMMTFTETTIMATAAVSTIGSGVLVGAPDHKLDCNYLNDSKGFAKGIPRLKGKMRLEQEGNLSFRR